VRAVASAIVTTPAGWYPDPQDPARHRYWDGAAWTAHVQSLAAVAAPPPPGGPSGDGAAVVAGGAIGGAGRIHSELLSDQRFAEVGSDQRVVRQNRHLLKVVLGEPVLARQGSMVAFQGDVDFDYEGSGLGRFLKKAVTGEGLPLMRCAGRGEVFLADNAREVHIVHLEQAGLSVNGRNVLAFEPSLHWDVERVQGAGMMAGGLFNTRLTGTGWVAITTMGQPVVLEVVPGQTTALDTDAVVAWSAGLTPSVNRTIKAKALIGRGSGEAFQLVLSGQGVVIVQPAEGNGVAPHSH
jgi:uncharacterized protein (AIM24 family)